MTPHELITEARAHGVELWADGGALKYRGDTKAVQAMLPAIRQHKPEIVAALTGKTQPGSEFAPVANQTYRPDSPPSTSLEAMAHAEAVRAAIWAGWVWHGGQWYGPGTWKPDKRDCPSFAPITTEAAGLDVAHDEPLTGELLRLSHPLDALVIQAVEIRAQYSQATTATLETQL